MPRFSRIARAYLIQIGNLNWKKINPDIFGSMIQAVADDEERGALGMHYTSVPNILAGVLNPLFLDDLRAALEDAGDNGRNCSICATAWRTFACLTRHADREISLSLPTSRCGDRGRDQICGEATPTGSRPSP